MTRAIKGGQYGINGEWYNGGEFLPGSETTIKGEFKTVKAQREAERANIAAKPKVAKKVKLEGSEYRFGFSFQYENEQDAKTGMTAYIWRHVAFYASPIREHQSMPTMDFCDLPGEYNDEQRQLAKRLEDIAAIVVDTIPLNEQHGTLNWGRAMGMI